MYSMKKKKLLLPFPRASTGFVCSEQNKKLFIIGGADREKVFNDFWEIEIELKENAQQLFGKELNLKKQPSMFSPRFGHTINIVNNNIYIFGGQNQFTSEIFNDLFCYDIKQDELIKLNPQNLPPPRNSHSSCYNEISQTILIYGGANSEGPLNDLYSYDIKANEFTQLQINDSGILQGREMHTMHIFSGKIKFEKQDSVMKSADEFKFEKFKDGKIISADFSINQQQQQQSQTDNKQELIKNENLKQTIELELQEEEKQEKINSFQQLIIIGGRTLDSISPYIYLIDSQFDAQIIKTLPQPICSHSSCIYKDCIYIYGGTNGKQFFNDIYIMELTTNNLFRCKIEQQLLLQMLTQRIASSMTIMDDNIIIYGGSEIQKENGEFIFLSSNIYSPNKNCQLC